MAGKKQITDEQKEKMFELLDRGVKQKYVAERFGISRGSVNKFVQEFKILKGVKK